MKRSNLNEILFVSVILAVRWQSIQRTYGEKATARSIERIACNSQVVSSLAIAERHTKYEHTSINWSLIHCACELHYTDVSLI